MQLFIQRLLGEKSLTEETVDSLVTSISRGTGHDFGGKNGFIQEANKCLEDLGYMVVRVNLNGTPWYSLKDLDYSASKNNADGVSEYFLPQSNAEEEPGSQATTAEERPKMSGTRFSLQELYVYFEAISQIISTRSPIPLEGAEAPDLVTWDKLCARHNINSATARLALAERFDEHKWLKMDKESMTVVPGVRFHVEFAESYDLSSHPDCAYCAEKVLCDTQQCIKCNSQVHLECTDIDSQGQRTCLLCLTGKPSSERDAEIME